MPPAVPDLDGKLVEFERWIDETKQLRNGPVYWIDVQERLFGGRSNPKIIGQEAADQRDYYSVEKGVEALERIVCRSTPGDEEAEGALEGVRQSMLGLTLLPQDSPPTVRDPSYRAFVRRYGCVICEHPAEAHHALGYRGMATKPSDYTCVPLCRDHHNELHRTSTLHMEEKYDVRFLETAFNLFHRYATGRWLTLRLEKVR